MNPVPRMEAFDTDEVRGSLLGVGEGGRLEVTEGKKLVRLPVLHNKITEK